MNPGVSTGVLGSAGNYPYQLQCTGDGDKKTPWLPVNVNVVAPGASINATPPRVKAGTNTSLSWSAQGVTKCSVFDDDGTTIQATSTATNNLWTTGSPKSIQVTKRVSFKIFCDTVDATVAASTIAVTLLVDQGEY